MNGTDKNVVLLELGGGEMTPSIIKLPFWEMTYKNENLQISMDSKVRLAE